MGCQRRDILFNASCEILNSEDAIAQHERTIQHHWVAGSTVPASAIDAQPKDINIRGCWIHFDHEDAATRNCICCGLGRREDTTGRWISLWWRRKESWTCSRAREQA